jgi:hypothetical protein
VREREREREGERERGRERGRERERERKGEGERETGEPFHVTSAGAGVTCHRPHSDEGTPSVWLWVS